jgi:hypothetical protein
MSLNITREEQELVKLVEQFENKITVTFTNPSPAAVFEDLRLSTLDLIRADSARLAVADEDFVALCEDPLAGSALGDLVERYMDWLTGGRGWFCEVADDESRSAEWLASRAN